MNWYKAIKEANDWDENFDDISGDINDDAYSQAWELADKSDINILRNKELSSDMSYDENGNVIGIYFFSWDEGEYSFDVIVDPLHQGKGIGNKLTDSAISQFNFDSEAYENPRIKADVVNPAMKHILLKKGFEVIEDYPGHEIMVKN
jgi:RimJ/RimL family protein N-acetyltransferase